MGWKCGKPMKVMRNGMAVPVKPGDPVPEAAEWDRRSPWMRKGFVVWEDDEPEKLEAPPLPVPLPPPPEPEPEPELEQEPEPEPEPEEVKEEEPKGTVKKAKKTRAKKKPSSRSAVETTTKKRGRPKKAKK
jgi:hypothetical protein